MIIYFMTKINQGVMFQIFWDQLMGVTGTRYLAPGNPKKYCEDKVRNHGQKAVSNVATSHK